MESDTTKDTAKQMHDILNNHVSNKNESLIFNALISECYHIGADSVEVEEIIREFYDLLVNDNNYTLKNEITDYINLLDDIYTDTEKPNSGLKGLQVMLKRDIGYETSRILFKKLTKLLKKYGKRKSYRMYTGTDTSIVMDASNKTVNFEVFNITRNKDVSSYKIVINAYPEEIIIHDNPVSDEGRIFSIKWASKSSKRLFSTKQSNIKDIEQYLEETGYITNPKHLKGTLASVIQIAIDNNLAIVKTEIDNPGFYYDDKEKKMLNINYEVSKPTPEQLKEALLVLDELGGWFNGHESKIAHGIKWGLIAPFGYMMKQIGNWIPWLYLFGRAGSGKTTVGKIILYLWETPNSDNDMGGSSFDTVARVGNRLSQSTFPILVNEPAGAFNRPSVVEIIKNCVEKTSSRGRYEGKAFKTIPAFAPVMFTANQYMPQDDALLRRMNVLSFSFNERKSEKEKEDFEETFKLNSPKLSKLNRLKAISMYFASEIKEDISLLELDWKTLANKLLTRCYADLEMQVPSWLLEWYKTTTLDDLDDEETEEFRVFLLTEINKQLKNIKVFDEETGYPKQEELINVHDIKKGKDFADRVWDVINHRMIPWMLPHKSRDNVNSVCFTTGMKKDLHKFSDVCHDLKSIAELLNWKYGIHKIPKPKRAIKVKFEDFIIFLYPELSEEKEYSVEKNGIEDVEEVIH